jgi:predicted flap endonuclease-1-like 5' DNA nuclease
LTELFFDMVWRVVRALLILALVAGVGVLLVTTRPLWVEETRAILVDRTALSFAAGLIVNLFGLALIGLLWLTVCFRPPAVVLGLIFVAANLAGLAVVGDEIGRKIEQRIHTQWQRPWRPVVGVVVPGAVIAFLWVLGSCFSFFAYLGALVLTSLGIGAFLVKVLKLGEPQPTAVAPVQESGSPVETSVGGMAEKSEVAEPVEVAVPTDAVTPVAVSEAQPESSVAAEMPEVETRRAEVPMPSAVVDDFTKISGVGPVFDQRLKAAGILTYADLAARTPTEIAEIIQWSQARVERSEILEQARRLALGTA